MLFGLIAEKPVSIPTPPNVTLRDYQIEGIRFLRDRKHAGVWDAPGLGKTLQAICATERPALVVCPGYLLSQWKAEIQRVYPDDLISLCEGPRWDRDDAIKQRSEWTICNFEMLRTYDFPMNFYRTMILDEAHHFRGHSAQQSKAAVLLAKRTEYVFQLTATPMKCEADDFYQQLNILDAAKFPSYNDFVERFCKTYRGQFKTQIVGVSNPEELRRTLKKYYLRRTYKGTGLKRPEPVHYPVPLTPSKDWYEAYRTLKDKYRLGNAVMENSGEVMRLLRQMTFALKVIAVKEIIEDTGPTIVYSFYRESAERLATELDIPFIHGGIKPQDRQAIAKSGTSVSATIASLSEGIDLSHLSNIIYVEKSYLPGDDVQTTARLVRWSEEAEKHEKIVRVYDIFVKNTIDTTILNTSGRRSRDERSILQEEMERS